jgi:hypothetical protein
LDFQDQLDRSAEKVNRRAHRTIRRIPAERLARERELRPLGRVTVDTDRRWVLRVPQQPLVRIDRNEDSSTRCSPAGVSRSGPPRHWQPERSPAPDTGKRHCETALGVRACLAEQRVQFATATQWVAKLGEAKRQGQPETEQRLRGKDLGPPPSPPADLH